MSLDQEVKTYFERELDSKKYYLSVRVISPEGPSLVVFIYPQRGLSAQISLSFNFFSGCLHCNQITIPAPHNGNGLGKSLVRAMENYSKSKGIDHACFEIDNPPFWRCAGYAVSERNGCKYASKLIN